MPVITVNSTPSIENSFNYIQFELSLDSPSNSPITVEYRTLYDGTATNFDIDNVFSSGLNNGTVTFAPGETSKIVQVEADRDTLDEADEHVVLELFDPVGANFLDNVPTLRTTGVILDDDGPGSNLALFVGDPVIVEGDSGTKQARFDIELSQTAASDLDFSYQTIDGSAKAGLDYVAASGNITIPAGSKSTSILVDIIGDTVPEAREWFALKLTETPGTVVDMTDSVGEAEIRDTDASPLPEISMEGGFTIEQSFDYMRFTISLSEAYADTVTVNYRLLQDGTATTYDIDNVFSSGQNNGTLVFAPGETTKSVFIEGESDGLDEVDENVVLELFDPTNASFGGGQPVIRANGVIFDDDGAGSNLALFVGDPVIVEGDSGTSLAQFEIQLSRPAPGTIEFSYQTVDGSALASQDFIAQSGTITFLEGQTRASVEVEVIGDLLAEGDETFGLKLNNLSATPVDMTDSFGNAEIRDTDASALPELSIQGDVMTENSFQYLRFTVSLSESFADTVTVNYRLLSDDTAYTYDIDNVFSSGLNNGTVTFAPGETTKSIFIEAERDTLDEADENVTLELFDPQNAVFGNGAPVARANGVILDDDGPGSNLALFVSDPVVTEGDSGAFEALFEINLSRPASSTMDFSFETIDGSAVAGADYVASSGTVRFVEGQTRAFVTVDILGDTAPEPSEFFMLKLTSLGATPVDMRDSVGEAEIRDTDTSLLPELSVQGDVMTENSFQYLRFTVSLSEPFGDTVTVNYRTRFDQTADGVDIDNVIGSGLNLGTLTFAPGETTKSVFIESEADGTDEADQHIVLELFDPTNALFSGGGPIAKAIGVILDDDGAGSNLALFVGDPVLTEADGGQTFARFDIELSRPASGDLTLSYETFDGTALAGSDYVSQTGTVTFVEGQTRASLDIAVVGDSLPEGTEWFGLRLSNDTGIPLNMDDAVGEAEIRDTDSGSLPQLVLGPAEGTEAQDNSIAFTVSLTEAFGDVVTVNYRLRDDRSADNLDLDDRFTSNVNNGSLTFAPGETSKTVYIGPERDGTQEADESFIFELFDPSNATFGPNQPVLRATGVILDNDGSGSDLAILVGDPVITEADSGTTVVNFDVLLSRPATTEITFDFETLDGSALAGEDYIARTGSLTFAEGQSRAAVQVEVIGDEIGEGAEWFGLRFENTSGLLISTLDAIGEATILDTDFSNLPEISVEGESTTERSFDYQRFVVTLSEASNQVVTVDWSFNLGSATADDVDFNLTREDQGFGTLTFAPGETTKSLFFEVDSDSLTERDESTYLKLQDPVNATFGENAAALTAGAFIQDNDSVGSTRAVFAAPTFAAEGDGATRQIAVDVLLSEASSLPLTFDISVAAGATATAGLDFQLLNNSITFEPNQVRVPLYIQIFDDVVADNAEFFDLVFTPTPGTVFFGDVPTTRVTINDVSPDLVVSGVSVTETQVVDGGTIEVSVTLSNEGNGTAFNPQFGIYLSSDATIQTADQLLATFSAGANIAPQGTLTVTNTVTLPVGLDGGSIFIGAIADPSDLIVERDESNNASLPDSVNVVLPLPDLSLTDLALDTDTQEDGETTGYSLQVNNDGFASADPVVVRLYLSQDATVSAGDLLLDSQSLASPLQSGQSSSITGSFTLPEGTTQGDYLVLAVVDEANDVAETNELNNLASAIPFEVINLFPDLSVSGLSLSTSDVEDGDAVQLTFTLNNLGNEAISGAPLAFYLSEDGFVSTADTLLSTLSVPQVIEGGGSREIVAQLTIPLGVTTGDYRIAVIADPDNDLAELSESNNTSASVGLSVEGIPADDPVNLFGGSGGDPLSGLANDDQLYGFGGDDTLEGRGGNDLLVGGSGRDMARFSGDQNEYTLTLTPTGATIEHRKPFGDGIDTLDGIELLDFNPEIDLFSNSPMPFDIFDGPAGLNAAEFANIIELYIAYFNRAPDGLGLFYWATEFANGFTLLQMANSFFTQVETRATYASVLDDQFNLDVTDAQKVGAFVVEVYDNVLGRAPDGPGFDYWTGELQNNPAVNPAVFILAVINGAKNPGTPTAQTAADQAYLATKGEIGAYFSVIKGMSDIEDARASMALYDGTPASVTAAVAAIDGHYADALDPDTGDFLMPLVGVIDDPFA